MIEGFSDKLLRFDLAVTFPKYINIRRGTYTTALASIVCNLVNSPTVFHSVMGGYVVFLSPMMGLMIASLIVIHRFRPKVDDLYVDNPSSIYWFSNGFNRRAPAVWALGTFPSLPGFIASVNPKVGMAVGLSHVISIYFFTGVGISFVVFILLHYLFPAPSLQAWVASQPSARKTMCEMYDLKEGIEIIDKTNDKEFILLSAEEKDLSDKSLSCFYCPHHWYESKKLKVPSISKSLSSGCYSDFRRFHSQKLS